MTITMTAGTDQKKKDKDRRERKVRRWCLSDRID